MTYYHCLNEHCEATFAGSRAKRCPRCGGKALRHAMGYEADRCQAQRQERLAWFPRRPAAGLAG